MNRQSKIKRGVLVVILLACLIALIGGTYSRYISTGTANATVAVAKWKVKLGTQDISTTPGTVDVNFVYDNNAYVKEGKIAPGTSGYFEVEVDPTESEVAIDYEFTIDPSNLTSVLETGSDSVIAVTGAKYTIDGKEAANATIDENGVVKFTESLSDVMEGHKAKIRVALAWDNANDAHNASDTAEGVASYNAGENGKTITIPVTVTAKQHID